MSDGGVSAPGAAGGARSPTTHRTFLRAASSRVVLALRHRVGSDAFALQPPWKARLPPARAGADGKSAAAATPRRGFAPRFHMPLGHGPGEPRNTAAAPRTRGRRGTPRPTTARPRHGATRVPLPRPQSWADEDGPCSTAPATRPGNDSYLPRPAPAAGVDGTGPPGAPSPCMADLTPNLMVLPRRPSVPRSGLSPLQWACGDPYRNPGSTAPWPRSGSPAQSSTRSTQNVPGRRWTCMSSCSSATTKFGAEVPRGSRWTKQC